MAGDQPRISKPPKLRSSCDACGAAKLKCDREQPECRRCMSQGITCVYGVSRKMGKPPRERLRNSITQSPSLDSGTTNAVKFDSSIGSEIMLDPGFFSSVMDDGNGLLDFPPLDFNDWAIADRSNDNLLHHDIYFSPLPTLELPRMGVCSSSDGPTPDSNQYHSQPDKHSHHRTPSIESGFRDHDCLQEAYKILGSLSGANFTKGYSTTSNTTTSVPLDHVLRLNREASEQLGHLLMCPCAKFPNLALLHASNIARILVWYHQAAVCTQRPSWSPASLTPDSASQHVSPAVSSPDYGSCSGACVSIWSSTANSTSNISGGNNTGGSTHSEMSVTPAKMAIGTFNVDDLRVQTALKIQLLLGEMRRAARLIDQFIASHGSRNQRLRDEPNCGGEDSLYQSLDSWLRNEHSRIANMMKSQLQELNT